MSLLQNIDPCVRLVGCSYRPLDFFVAIISLRPKVMPFRRGDIYWVEEWDTDHGSVPPIPHPHVIVQDDVFNESRVHTTIVCALTSNLRRATEPGNVLLDIGEGQLERQSVVIVSQVSSIEERAVGEFIGRLSRERVVQILAGLRFQQRSFGRRL